MKTLSELQKRFQSGILARDDAILDEIEDGSKESREVLFGVYRNAYVSRLSEILATDYEILRAYLGESKFAELAVSYMAAHPSDSRSVRDFGRHLPAFLGKHPGFGMDSELAELAELEKALNDAFDGSDATPLALSDLAAFPPAAWPKLVLTPHPTARHLVFGTNAADIWAALKRDEVPPTAQTLEEPCTVLVWRQDVTSRFRVFAAEEAMMWNEAVRGTCFGDLCGLVATFGGEDGADFRAASYLKEWIEAEMLAGCHCA